MQMAQYRRIVAGRAKNQTRLNSLTHPESLVESVILIAKPGKRNATGTVLVTKSAGKNYRRRSTLPGYCRSPIQPVIEPID